jgi:hypothetical protein
MQDITPKTHFIGQMRERIPLTIDLIKAWCQQYKHCARPLIEALVNIFSNQDLVCILEEALLPAAPELLEELYREPKLYPTKTQALTIAKQLPSWNLHTTPDHNIHHLTTESIAALTFGNPGVYVDIGTPYMGSSFNPWTRWRQHRTRGHKGTSKAMSYHTAWNDSVHFYVLLMSFQIMSNTSRRIVDIIGNAHLLPEWSKLSDDGKQRAVARALAFLGECIVMVTLGHYCHSPTLEKLAKDRQFPLRSLVPLPERHNRECAIEQWHFGNPIDLLQTNSRHHLLKDLFDLEGPGLVGIHHIQMTYRLISFL